LRLVQQANENLEGLAVPSRYARVEKQVAA
jgi:hypothetical protein